MIPLNKLPSAGRMPASGYLRSRQNGIEELPSIYPQCMAPLATSAYISLNKNNNPPRALCPVDALAPGGTTRLSRWSSCWEKQRFMMIQMDERKIKVWARVIEALTGHYPVLVKTGIVKDGAYRLRIDEPLVDSKYKAAIKQLLETGMNPSEFTFAALDERLNAHARKRL